MYVVTQVMYSSFDATNTVTLSGPSVADVVVYHLMLILFGIQLSAYCVATCLLTSQGLRQSKPRQYLLLALTVLAISCMITIGFSMRHASRLFAAPTTSTVPERYINLLLVSNISGVINFIISDAIVVWRAWVLWHESRAARTILTLCMSATIVLGGSSLVLSCLSILRPGHTAVNNNYMLCIPLLATNVIATGFIGVRTWLHRREMRALLGRKRRRTSIERVLLLLFESGILYCSLWVVIILCGQGTLTSSVEKTVIQLAIIISALYPTLVVIMVSLGKSLAESAIDMHSGISAMQGSDDLERGPEPIRFRSPNPHASSMRLSDIDDASSSILPHSSVASSAMNLDKRA